MIPQISIEQHGQEVFIYVSFAETIESQSNGGTVAVQPIAPSTFKPILGDTVWVGYDANGQIIQVVLRTNPELQHNKLDYPQLHALRSEIGNERLSELGAQFKIITNVLNQIRSALEAA